MEFLPSPLAWALPVAALLLLSWLWMRVRGRRRNRRSVQREDLDTVTAWPPQAVRVLTVAERQAYELLRRALPGYVVLAQVPLSRFLRVPTRNSYTEWVQRVGLLNADLLLCDAGSRVLIVIDVRTRQETPRAQHRHARMVRVLQAAGVRVLTWYEDALPTLNEVRNTLTPLVADGSPSRPMPLATPSLEQALAAGDAASRAAAADEPVPSAFFEDCEPEIGRR